MSTGLSGSVGVIYLDNHASTPLDPRVLAAMTPFFAQHFANPHASDHAEGWRAHDATEGAAAKLAKATGCDADEIVFTSGATEANNLAILGLARRASPSRRRILVSSVEHKCVLASARATRSLGFTVEVVPVDNQGFVDTEVLQRRLADDVLVVSVMAVNNEVGTIQDVATVSGLARKVGAHVHTDAVQAMASGPIDVNSWDVDTLSLSAHKIYGPKGVGALFIRRDVQQSIEPLIYGGGQQDGIRSGTLPVPLCVGFAEAAIMMTDEGAHSERVRLAALRDKFVDGLQRGSESVRLNGPNGDRRHPGNANLRFTGLDARDLIAAMQPQVAASTGAACSTGIPEPSHVLRAIGLTGPEAESSIRFSLGRFTSDSQVAQAVEIILGAVRLLRVTR